MEIKNNIEQYGYFYRYISRVPLSNSPENYIRRALVQTTTFPDIDFSACNTKEVFRQRIPFLVVNPFIDKKTIIALLGLSENDYNRLKNGTSVIMTAESTDGRFKRGEIVNLLSLGASTFKTEKWCSGSYAFAYLLYCKDYYRFNEDGEYTVSDVTEENVKALAELYENGLDAEDIFIYDIFGPTELPGKLEQMEKGVECGDMFTDYYYRIFRAIARAKYLYSKGLRAMFFSQIRHLQQHVEELYVRLAEAGMEFKSDSSLK